MEDKKYKLRMDKEIHSKEGEKLHAVLEISEMRGERLVTVSKKVGRSVDGRWYYRPGMEDAPEDLESLYQELLKSGGKA